MANNAEMRLQLIVEAVNRFQTTFDAFQREINAIDTQTARVATGGTRAGQALDQAGRQGAAGFNQAHASLTSVYRMIILITGSAIVQKLAAAGIGYNRELETSKLGIAAIMTSMGVITDAQGQVLKGQEKWNAAQELTVDAQRELQKIAMATPATYQEVVQAYQGLLAPSLGAKLNFKETLELAGLLTNSVKAMGLPAQQIVQEGRDLVAGTIDQNSQLARSLQISNEDVKKWREKGTVFQEIKGRLEGFVFASREFENTWEGAWSNFKDYAQRALGEGSKPLFNFLKGEMTRLSRDLVTITRDAQGNVIDVQVKPEVIARIRELSEDLKKLIQFLELAVSWGVKLAEPAIFTAIAVGIGKITIAVRELAVASKSINATVVGAIVTAAAMLGKAGYDAHNSTETDDVRKRYNEMGGKDNLGWLGPQKLADLKNRYAMDNADVARALKAGVLKRSQEANDNIYGWSDFDFNEAALKKFMETGSSKNNLAGSGKQTAEEIKKARAAALAALEDSYAESKGIYQVGEAAEAEAIKTGLKEKELAYQQGLISQEEYLKQRDELQQKGLVAELNAVSDQQAKLTREYLAKAAQIEDPKELSEAHKSYVTEWYRLEVEYTKKAGALKQATTDAEIQQLEQKRKVEQADRDGALKLLQERLNGESQLNKLLLDRERITPLEAERRSIANEQAGLEAEYWKTFGDKMAARDSATITALERQLQVLEERLSVLDAATPERLYKAGKETAGLEQKKEEARITHELDELEERQKLRQIGTVDALRQKAALTEELLNIQLQVQAGIDPTDTTAWNSQQQAIDATRQKLLGLKLEMREFSGDWKEGVKEGLSSYVDSLGGDFKKMQELTVQTAQAMQDSFSDLFFDAMRGKMKSFSDYFNAFMKSVERALANALAQKLTGSLLGGSGLGSLFGLTSQAMGGVWQGGVQKFALGGVVYQPTLFPTMNGLGMMGEAGEEAIMPLTRTASGHLGVRAVNGGNSISVGPIYGYDKREKEQVRAELDEAVARVMRRH